MDGNFGARMITIKKLVGDDEFTVQGDADECVVMWDCGEYKVSVPWESTQNIEHMVFLFKNMKVGLFAELVKLLGNLYKNKDIVL